MYLKFLPALLALGFAIGARADDTREVFARYQQASGGARWDAVRSLRSQGTLKAGGLEGGYTALVDVVRGRSSSHYRLGPIEGAQGYDGNLAWTRDPGGEVATRDAPEARREARSQAWLDARGHWYPARHAATTAAPQARELEGRRYEVVVATPEGGDPVTLWFDAGSHLLARVEQKQGADTAVTTFGDWREVGGLRLPFHLVTDRVDTAGRIDARNRIEVLIARYTPDAPIADADFARPAMEASARIEAPGGVARVPFELVNNHIYAAGSIDGKPARFLVDTGGMNLLTPESARRFGLEGEGKLAARGVGDEMVDVGFAHAKQVRLGDAVLDKPVFVVMDLGRIAAVEGHASDGLVGYEMFRRFGVTIDYERRELVLAERAKFVPPPGAHAVPFDFAERIPVVEGRLDGMPGRFSVDTGSRASLSLHSPFVREHGLVAKYDAAPEAVTGWGVGGSVRGRPARLGTLRIGDVSIDRIAGDLFTGDKGAFASPDLAGNIGGGVLRRFTVAFDYEARRMYLVPNAAYAEPDAFDRSGLWLIADGDALEIADVAEGSAARRAGLRAGDRIRAIDGAAIPTRSLGDWRRLLRERAAGTPFAIDYHRAGKPARTQLVLADRIP